MVSVLVVLSWVSDIVVFPDWFALNVPVPPRTPDPCTVKIPFPGLVKEGTSQVLSLLKNLVPAAEVPSTADKSAVTVTLPDVAEFGVRFMYVPSVVVTVSTPLVVPTSIQPGLPKLSTSSTNCFKVSAVVLKIICPTILTPTAGSVARFCITAFCSSFLLRSILPCTSKPVKKFNAIGFCLLLV